MTKERIAKLLEICATNPQGAIESIAASVAWRNAAKEAIAALQERDAEIADLKMCYDEVRERRDVFREALKFHANEKNHEVTHINSNGFIPVAQDKGELARACTPKLWPKINDRQTTYS